MDSTWPTPRFIMVIYHERQDCRTMQKVPNEIHGNLPHRGGVSVIKERNNTEEGIFDEWI